MTSNVAELLSTAYTEIFSLGLLLIHEDFSGL
jgi:hypothetical protein